MAIKTVVSNIVGFKVKGTINNAAGTPEPFDFALTCNRLNADQIQAKLKSDSEASITDFLADVVTDWSNVRDGDDKTLLYSDAHLRELCKIPGIANIVFRTYMSEVGAKEKN